MQRFLQTGLAAACCTIVLISCKRDVIEHKIPETVGCRIKQVIMKTDGVKEMTGTFTYNSNGNPVTYTPVGYSPGSVKYEFRYDKNHRLTDYIGYYPRTGIAPLFEFWTKYAYGNSDQILRDTTYYYGMYGAELTTYSRNKGVTAYEYDKIGRISRTVYRQSFDGAPNGVIKDYKYSYNPEGNLVTPGAAYDNKVSIYRTHNIWMFLNRNYSTNNLRNANSYNAKGLPSIFDHTASRGHSMYILEFINLSNCEIVYECN
jgi:hypothetical protein